MIIKKLQLRNFQAIKDFDADFTGDVYLIKGENELGKSTILKSIVCLLTGERDAVLRNGEKNGFAKMVIRGDGKEYTVELRFSANDPRGTISIKAKDGMRSTNVSMLRTVLNYRNFDAEEFARWSETAEGRRKQIQVVMALLPETIRQRITQIDADTINIKESRKDANATLKIKSAELESIKAQLSDGDTETYTEPIDLSELMQESAKAAARAADATHVKEKMEKMQKRIGRGESLGTKRLQSIVNLAKQNGFQGFIEQVERGQETISIEEYREA